MNVGIVCYASTGGSGIVATELAIELAERGHDVHVLSTEPPFRFPSGPLRLPARPFGFSFGRQEVVAASAGSEANAHLRARSHRSQPARERARADTIAVG